MGNVMNKITQEHVSHWIPERKSQSYKGNFGRIACVGGNEQMGGAIILSSSAALYSGAGLVTTASAPENVHALHSHVPEAMFLNIYDLDQLKELIPTMDVIVIGPGLGRTVRSIQVLRTVYESVTEDQHLIVDGDAIFLHVNQRLDIPAAHTIFTPHLGEWQTLTGLSPDEENLKDNQKKQKELNATVVLKKDRTQIYFEENVWENTTGNPSMATGGMGDTLTGMLAGLLGQLKNPKEAILAAVYLHSFIGDELAKENYVTLPSQIIQEIPRVMNKFAKKDSN